MTKNNNSLIRRKPLALIIGALLAPQMAFAQEADLTTADEAEEVTEKITVTGSRIRSGGFDEARPVDIIDADMAIDQGLTSIGSLLQASTVAAGSPQVTAASSIAFNTNGGAGSQTLSLRGLGANRTLVLLNGRRAGPAGTRGGVSSFDFNTLPISTIQRVEILKDGASSVYGSDAVAGVVNIITKKDTGGQFDVFASQPTESGGEQYRFSGTYGKELDKGFFSLTADYQLDRELAKGNRDYFNCGERYIFDPATGERADNIDPRTGKYHCNDLLWGHVWIYDYQDGGPNDNVPSGAKAQYDYDGDLGQYIPGFNPIPGNPNNMRTPPGWFPVNYDDASDAVSNADHPFQDSSSLIPETEKITLFGQAEYELNDHTQLYAEALLNRRTTESNGYRQYWSYIYNENFFAGNPLSEGWRGSQWLSPTAITDHSDDKITVEYQRYVAGITGDIAGTDWYYDVSYQYSNSDGDYGGDIIYDDAISDQNFASGSCAGTVTSVRGVDCVDIPWLDPQLLAGNVSQEVRDFMFGYEVGNTKYTQQTFEGFVSGPVFELPAGEVGAVFGASFQKDRIKDTPGEATLAQNTWGSSAAGITSGSDETKAVFTELNVPVISDVFLAQFIDLELSARYTDVKSSGDDTTFKIGVNWQIDDQFRIRASRGTSFRSPALFELYLADQTGFLGQRAVDPCVNWGNNLTDGSISQALADNCAADGIPADFTGGAISATTVTGGGFGVLEPETSVAKTLGLVWTPEFANLSVSIDYFDFLIEGEVTQIGAANIVSRCYNSDFFPTDPICGQFDRDPVDNRITEIRDSFINVAEQSNRGYDIALNYNVDVGYGEVTFDMQHTFQKEARQGLFEDTVIDTNGEFGDPKHVANYNLRFDRNNWSVNWRVNYIGAVSNVDSYFQRTGDYTATVRGDEVDVVLGADSVMYHAFSFTYDFAEDGLKTTLGVSNAFNKKPPRVTTLNLGELNTEGNSAFYSQYDWYGRRIFLNATYQF